MKIQIERIYASPAGGGGYRVLVDRLWPRGLKKEAVRFDQWLADIAPSNELRKWFAHDPAKWPEFKRRYFKELDGKKGLLEKLLADANAKTIILLYGAKDQEHNQAVALKEYIEAKL